MTDLEKKAEEKAKELIEPSGDKRNWGGCHAKWCVCHEGEMGDAYASTKDETVSEIASALVEFANDAILDDRTIRTADDLYKASYERGLREGLEEAVEIIAKEIRAVNTEK